MVLVGAALLWLIVYVGGLILEVAGLISFSNVVPVWVAALVGGIGLGLGLLVGRRIYLLTPQAHELYTEHLRDALADLRRLTAGELPDFTLRDYIENGLFQTAHRLLTTRGRSRGDVRFSILHPAGDDFVMSGAKGLFPAFGHTPEARQAFRIRIDDSFSGLTFRTGRTQVSNDLQHDERWKPHPNARAGRGYESIVSVPLIAHAEVDGVLNVIAAQPHAFQPVDQTYITLLASVIDVARSIDTQSD